MIRAKKPYNNPYSGSETQVLRLTDYIRPEVLALRRRLNHAAGCDRSADSDYRRFVPGDSEVESQGHLNLPLRAQPNVLAYRGIEDSKSCTRRGR